MHQRWLMEQDLLWEDSFPTASWLRSSLETLQEKRFSFPGLASSLPTIPLSSKGYSSLSEYATHLPVTKLKVKSNIILVKCSINAHSNWILKIRWFFFRPDSQSFRYCTARHWDVFPWPTVCSPVKVWGKQEHHHIVWQNKEDEEYCLSTSIDKNWHGWLLKTILLENYYPI